MIYSENFAEWPRGDGGRKRNKGRVIAKVPSKWAREAERKREMHLENEWMDE